MRGIITELGPRIKIRKQSVGMTRDLPLASCHNAKKIYRADGACLVGRIAAANGGRVV